LINIYFFHPLILLTMKFSIALNLLLAVALGYMFFKQYEPTPNPKVNCKDPCTQHFLNGLSTPITPAMISYTTAVRMSTAYHQDKGKCYINGDPERPDALSITFPMEQMKNFVWTVDRLVCEQECSNQQLGVKVYYGKYPKETGLESASADIRRMPTEYADRHSLFFVPVIRANDHQDWQVFDPTAQPTNCVYPNIPPDSIKLVAYLLDAPPAGPADANNHGGLRPPPYDQSPLTFPR
jgi:hypothetical protein